MTKSVLIVLAQGTEEIEAIVPADLLRRANIHVRVAGENEISTCSRGIKIIPDILIEQLNSDMEFSTIIIPGGKTGTHHLLQNEKFIKLLDKHIKRGGYVAAICAAPSILTAHKLLPQGTKLTSHPSIADLFDAADYQTDKVVVSGNFITSRGAGTVFEFSLKIIEILLGKEASDKIAADIVWG